LKGSSAFSQSSLFHLFFFLFIEPKFLLPFSFIFYDRLGRRSQTADEFGGMDGDHSIKVQEEEKKNKNKIEKGQKQTHSTSHFISCVHLTSLFPPYTYVVWDFLTGRCGPIAKMSATENWSSN
jgi:hypothetical protein